MTDKKFDLEVKAGIKFKEIPGSSDIKQKAVAGASEKDLIERHTIGQIKKREDEEQDETQTTVL